MPLDREIVESLKKEFKAADHNGDGKLNPAELRDLLKAKGIPSEKVAETAKQMFIDIDKNNDGTLTMTEICKHIADLR
eukprot:CAMPEP_0197857650 /NCGR_PEP_ID=MMETSP1438-20131217/30946_1 /TAXON_ID=1461541 /ORGANISM="Pterosperma sp., Strain CCMP1384" /LENGTH=77 /DNA_ID=CAMNT_0043473561 /DNA_START=125 /DNA_END=358 /DNA_ORIENTATION=-